METTKKLNDAQVLEKVIKATRLTRNGFAKRCNYKSAMSIYNVLEGRNDMSEDMKTRIAVTFPEISYSYLQSASGDIFKANPDKYNTIKEVIIEPKNQNEGTLSDFATVPATLLRIEALLKEILSK